MSILRSALLLTSLMVPGFSAGPTPEKTTLVLRADKPGPVINANLYGQFTEHLGHCIYGGIWVGERSPIPNTRGIRNDVVAALRKLKVPVVRWPGGCFADEYHWKNGIGPRDKRPSMINNNWGGVVEDNSFGTHEFFDFCEQIGAQPYVCGNLGSGTPQEMMEWVEYITSDADSPMANLRRANGREKPWQMKYFAVGNENWGCGGNMRPEFYADNFRRYSVFLKDYPGNRLYRVACGPSGGDERWTKAVMDIAGQDMDGLSLHAYTVPTGRWDKKGSATDFDEVQWHATLRGAFQMDEYITRHSALMDRIDPAKKVGLLVDEWGVWTDPEPGTNPGFLVQQNSLRDALLAALHFHVFQAHADRVSMANIAQMVNVLQAMILTDQEKLVLTPTYHVFEMYNIHQGATALAVETRTPDYVFQGQKLPAVSASASRDAAGKVHLSLVNTQPSQEATLDCDLRGFTPKQVHGRILTAPTITAHNTFAAPEQVRPLPFTAMKLAGGRLQVSLPAKSVVVVELQ